MENIIRDYLKAHINEPMDNVLQGLEKTLQSCVSDRRFKLSRLNFGSNGSGTSWAGSFSFMVAKYYIGVIQPWSGCPSGEVIAERIN